MLSIIIAKCKIYFQYLTEPIFRNRCFVELRDIPEKWRYFVWDGLGHNRTLRTKQDFGNQHKGSILCVSDLLGHLAWNWKAAAGYL